MSHHPFSRTTRFLCGALLCLFAVGATFAQTGTSNVSGTVVDAQGNAVAGATVTLLNAEKNFNRTQTTNEQGGYTFTAVPPDTYRVEAEAPNFKRVAVSDVRALVDTPTTIDVQLETGNVTETVDVSAATEAPLNTTDATIGNAFESQRIEELPLNARNVVGLLSLQPGVTRDGEVNGGRRDQSNITLDGVDNNEQQTGLDVVAGSTTVTPGEAFAGVLRVTPDSVQEFRVTTSNPNATQGRSSGAQVSLVTKTGTNNFNGSLYYFHRNTVTTANDYFNNALGRDANGEEIAKRPKLLRNIFGGTLGGPIVKNRAFFFYSYEGRRDASEISVLRNVPTATLRQGIVQYRNTSGGTTTLTPADIARIYPQAGGVNPAGLAILQTAPLPNDFTIGDGLNRAGFRFNAPISTEFENHIAKFDLTITDRQTLFVRGNYQDDLYGRASAFPGTPSPSLWVHPKGLAIGHTWSLTDTLVNTARFGLTRVALSQQGDSSSPSVAFRDVYSPLLYARTLNRTTPTFNIVDDVSIVKGTHTIQFGGNLRFIRNDRESFANSFDAALVNFQFYATGGSSLLNRPELVSTDDNPNPNALASGFRFDYGRAVASALGRFSQYSINSVFGIDGQPLAAGSGSVRSLATEEYELYAQDSWKIRPNLTLTYGLRYSINTPVYERTGLQLVPDQNLGEFLDQRLASAAAGTPYNELITFNRGGKANEAPGFYSTDKNNFAPLIAVAYSPDFGDSFFGRALGRNGRSVIRGGFRMLYDRIGSQLAVSSEAESSFGFSSSATNGSTSTNATDRLGPLVNGLSPDVRSFPRISAPASLTFPLSFPADEVDRIISGIDQSVVSPVQYTWNATYGRELPKGFSFEVGYIGRSARNLLLVRDVMHLNNLVDSRSGADWYTAAGQLNDLRLADTPIGNAGTIPYFQNLFPNLGPNLADLFGEPFFANLTPTQAAFALHARDGFNVTDFTAIQQIIDDVGIFPNAFFHPQYAALQTFSSVGRSDYHGGIFSVRQRFRNSFLFDFNYTFSKSMDNASTLETLRALSNVVRNPIDPDLEYSVSDFDIRHNINANFLAELPIGRDRKFFSNMNPVLNAIFGGFQLSGILRYNTGLPAGSPGDIEWATNWQSQSNGVRLRDVSTSNDPNVADPTGVSSGLRPNIFTDPVAAYRSFRNARAGEVGDRNISTLRIPSYFVLDTGLTKNFNMPYAEGHRLQFRWEVFNVTNTQRFGVLSNLTLNPEPFVNDPDNLPSADFGRYIGSQTPVGESRAGRVMQFALRYVF
ncbi:MAG: TonB-dependent receptor [Pyrinomonadaceae bacterium MAG19_C2-C3]|nr:TonB-dependent receptor [Pyrinomonadaceae bacterium MAG19_C2-C3]